MGRGRARPPGPRGYPLIGSAGMFVKEPLRRFEQLVHDYGDVVHYRIGRTEMYLLSHPDAIGSVLVGEHHEFMKDALTHELSFFLGRGLLTAEGSFWRKQRKLIAPTFQRRHIEKFADTMVQAAGEGAARLQPGIQDVHAEMMELALDIVLKTVFGDASVSDPAAVGRVVEVLMGEFLRSELSWRRLLPSFFKEASAGRLEKGREELDGMLLRMIDERRRAGIDGDDLLGRLLAATDDEGHRMSDAQLRNEVATLFLAGHETTALTLSFGLYLLAAHPGVQRRLAEEIQTVVGDRPVTLADVPKLPFCDAVVRESMRLYPPAYVIGREALEDVQIGGWTIPRGAQVLLPQWTVHRDVRWYDNPLAFEPERWLDGLADRLPRFAYFPFGGGARVCVGKHFAMLEAALCIATLMQHVEVSADPSFELELMPSVTLRPAGGVRVDVSRRAPSQRAAG